MWPWIGFTAVGLFLDIFSIFNFGKVHISLDITNFISWVLSAYFFLVVWSFKAEVEDGESIPVYSDRVRLA